MAEPAPVYDKNDSKPVTRPDLESLEGGGETSEPKRGHLRAVPDSEEPGGEGDDGGPLEHDFGDGNVIRLNSDDPEERAAFKERFGNEGQQTDETPSDEPGFYREDGKKKGKLKAKIEQRKKNATKKFILIIGAMGGVGLIAAVVMIFLLLNALKIQNLATHVLEYNMVRAARTFRQGTEDTFSERLAIDDTSTGLADRIASKYTELRSNTWGKFDRFRPAKVLQNLQADKQLQFVYEETPRTGVLGKLVGGTTLDLKAVRIGGEDIALPEIRRLHYFSNVGNKIRFANQVDAALERAVPDTPNLIRSSVGKSIRQDLGVPLTWWQDGGRKFKNLKESDAFELEQQNDYEKIKQPPNSDALVPELNDQAKKASDAEDQAVRDGTASELSLKNAAAQELADDPNTKIAPAQAESSVATAIEAASEQSLGATVLENLSTAYQIALPVCMIFDGSTVNRPSLKDSIDAKNTALTREFYGLQTAADQQKAGETTAEAVGAFNKKLGNIGPSLPELRAAGKTLQTSQFASGPGQPQTGPLGDITLANVIFGDNNLITSLVNHSLKDICPLALDLRTAALGVAIEFALKVISGGSEAAVSEAAQTGAEQATKIVVKDTLEKSITSRAFGFIRQLGKDVVKFGTLTILAKLIVLNHMNGSVTGLSTGSDFATETDMGAMLHSNEIQRQGLYGRPLTAEELQASQSADVADLVHNQQSKSFNERYFALSNPDSLLARFGLALQTTFSNWRTLGLKIMSFFSPMNNIVRSLHNTPIFGQKVFAATTSGQSFGNYGIAQWGWSEGELSRIRADDSYGIVVNAEEVARNPGLYQQVEADYGDCFTQTMGKIISEEWIKVDANGASDPSSGKCSPNNLGINNSKYGDAVFRWRLSHRNDFILNHLSALQDAGISK